jgi:hypothetical protein
MKITKIDELMYAIKFDDELEAASMFKAMEGAPTIDSCQEREEFKNSVVKNEVLKYMKGRFGTQVGLMKNVISRRVALTSIFDDERGLIVGKVRSAINELMHMDYIKVSMHSDKENDVVVSLTGQGAEYIKTIK